MLHHSLTRLGRRRHACLLVALLLLGLLGLLVAGHLLPNALGGLTSGTPRRARAFALIPLIIGLHPLLALLHPILLLLVSLGATTVGILKRRSRQRSS